MMRTVFAAMALLLAVQPVLAIEDLDPQFSGDGIAFIDQGDDWPVITCPAAAGKRLLVNRVGESTVRASRVLDNGQLDPQFGNGGAVNSAVQTYPGWRYLPALCRPDGSVWIATEVRAVGSDNNVRVFAIGANGQLQTSFGGAPGGLVDIDLDQHRPDLSDLEYPRGIIEMPDGGALIVGHARVATISRDRPFLIKLSAQGVLQRVAFPEPAGMSESIRASAAAVGPGGGIWVVGDGWAAGPRAYRMYIDPKNYAVVRTEIGADVNMRTSSGALLRSGVMVVTGTKAPVVGQPAEPRLLVFRANTTSFTTLALPNPLPGTAGVGQEVQVDGNGATLLALSPDRVMLAAGVNAHANGNSLRDAGFYVARAIIGDTPAQDRVDVGFGIAGRDGLSVPSGDPSCSGQTNRQAHAHVGLWAQRPLILGRIAMRCNPDSDDDLLLLRLKSADELLRNGFE